MSEQFVESDEQFQVVGEKLMGSFLIPEEKVRECRDFAAAREKESQGGSGVKGGELRAKE